MTSIERKAAIDTNITTKTANASVTTTIVGAELKSNIDYVVQEIEKVTPVFKKYVALLTKAGAVFTLTECENTLGQTLSALPDSGNANKLLIKETETANFLTAKSIVKVTDTAFGANVLVKATKEGLNQIGIYAYYNGDPNINFADNLQVEICTYV